MPFFLASSAKGTSFLIGDSGICCPFKDIPGIFQVLNVSAKLRNIIYFFLFKASFLKDISYLYRYNFNLK